MVTRAEINEHLNEILMQIAELQALIRNLTTSVSEYVQSIQKTHEVIKQLSSLDIKEEIRSLKAELPIEVKKELTRLLVAPTTNIVTRGIVHGRLTAGDVREIMWRILKSRGVKLVG